ncbi:protein kinase domain-containing protein [Sorangium sp. So ce131]|uniref:serine/threonine-protein kinase n=1 Tax=Sorangium sp. So ce131 TaxID=3133282 RepID=UPI003F5FA61C
MRPTKMRVGGVLGDRFTLEALAGSGGMGEVFRARDRATGQAVAVKVMLARHAGERARFQREVQVLSELRHPAVVQFVAHGATPEGEPYLAMEWLEGEDLRSRLARGMLGVEESAALAARVAGALAVAHARGVVHRDLKPSNLFLPSGDVAQVKVLDFGIAHLGDVTRLTRTGAIVGTPGYMAPEQAGGAGAPDARADVFALGCVLFECLTGTPAFSGEHLIALLAKIRCEEPPRVGALRAGVPWALEELVARMLAKEPDRRPRDGASVAAELSALDEAPSGPRGAPALGGPPPPAPTLAAGERRVISVVMIGRETPLWLDTTESLGPHTAPEEDELRSTAASFGGRLEVLADGSAAVTLSGVFVATDLAARAARCALALHATCPGRPMALATGWSETSGAGSLGDAIDRAARLVARRGPGAPPILLDEVTAGLLDARFEVAAGAAGPALVREREVVAEARALLGKRTACVGRARELSMLEGLLSECVDEPVARAVLVTAPAGVGKSRLCQEFLRAARARGEPIEIWIGRGDALRGGQAFGPLGQALRGACEIREDDPPEARREKLRARIARHVAPAERARVTVFLGEIAGAPFADEESGPLRAARRSAELMSEQVRRALEDFVLAECAAGPVLLALDDLHWADRATVRLVDAALRVARDLPFLVLASARPEVHERFPRLWAERELQEIRLQTLTPKASEQLVRQVLGDGVSPETVKRLVARSRGHAFYLEELIRAVAEGRGDTLPETVAAMVQAWLERFEPEARRLLRTASIFGVVFWQGAVASLLGGGSAAGDTGAGLTRLIDRLVQQEALVRRPESRFAGEPELSFRHALLAEGAYAMLTEDDRALGHRLAGEWLERRGESSSLLLAEHFERGGEPARAAGHYRLAAEQVARLGDTETAIAYAHRGLACAPSDELRIAFLSVLWEVYLWGGDLADPAAARDAEQMMALTTPGSGPWARGALLKLFGLMATGQREAFTATLSAVRAVGPLPDAAAAVADALCVGVSHLLMSGQPTVAEPFLRWLEAIVQPVAEREPRARGLRDMARSFYVMYADEDPWSGLRWAEAALESFEQAGSPADIAHARTHIAIGFWLLGAYARAEQAVREAPSCTDEDLWIAAAHRSLFLGAFLIDQGKLEEARVVAEGMLGVGRTRSGAVEGMGHSLLIELYLRHGDLEAAEREACTAREQLAGAPSMLAPVIMLLAFIRLSQGRVAEALAAAEEGMAQYEALRLFFVKGSLARLIHAEVLMAAGDQPRALAAIADARARLLVNAAKIGDPELRRSFLEDVRENARTLELARAWLGEA